MPHSYRRNVAGVPSPSKEGKGRSKKRKTQADNDNPHNEDSVDEHTFVFGGYGKDLVRDREDKATLDKIVTFA